MDLVHGSTYSKLSCHYLESMRSTRQTTRCLYSDIRLKLPDTMHWKQLIGSIVESSKHPKRLALDQNDFFHDEHYGVANELYLQPRFMQKACHIVGDLARHLSQFNRPDTCRTWA